jgi:hypothetical protein
MLVLNQLSTGTTLPLCEWPVPPCPLLFPEKPVLTAVNHFETSFSEIEPLRWISWQFIAVHNNLTTFYSTKQTPRTTNIKQSHSSAANRWLPTAAARSSIAGHARWDFCRKRGTGICLLQALRLPLLIIFAPNAPHSFILPIVAVRPDSGNAVK